jgi:Flp pilus assembly protein TadG
MVRRLHIVAVKVPTKRPRFRTRLRSARGAQMIEAAVITPLLLLLTFGIVEFGALFYVYLSLQNGVSQATRYAITGQTNPDSTRAESIKARMRQATPTLTLDDGMFTFEHMTPGSTNWTAGVGGPNDIEKVTVTYTWDIMTPLMRPFFEDGQIQFRAEAAMKNEGAFN